MSASLELFSTASGKVQSCVVSSHLRLRDGRGENDRRVECGHCSICSLFTFITDGIYLHSVHDSSVPQGTSSLRQPHPLHVMLQPCLTSSGDHCVWCRSDLTENAG